MSDKPTAPAKLIAKLGAAVHGATLLVGPGQYPLGKDVSRVFVLRTDAHAPRLLWDGAIANADIDALRRALASSSTVVPAELDAMYATDWTLAWTVNVPDFRLYDTSELLCELMPECLRVHGRQRRDLQRSSLRRVVGCMEPGTPDTTICSSIEADSPSGRWTLLDGRWSEGDYIHRDRVLLDRSNGALLEVIDEYEQPHTFIEVTPAQVFRGEDEDPNVVDMVGESDVGWMPEDRLWIDGLLLIPERREVVTIGGTRVRVPAD